MLSKVETDTHLMYLSVFSFAFEKWIQRSVSSIAVLLVDLPIKTNNNCSTAVCCHHNAYVCNSLPQPVRAWPWHQGLCTWQELSVSDRSLSFLSIVEWRHRMFFSRLRLLILKSLRYAWRRRLCRCCPKVLFELGIPAICLLLLYTLRWIHSPSVSSTHPTKTAPFVVPARLSKSVWNYTSVYRCPSANRTIEILDTEIFDRLRRLCRRSSFILNVSPGNSRDLLLNSSLAREHQFTYRCRYEDRQWCQSLRRDHDAVQLQNASTFCSSAESDEWKPLVRNYLALESLLHRPRMRSRLSIHTWPCSSYLYDKLFEVGPRFALIIMTLLIDGCILFSFYLLLQSLIAEKEQGMTELLRLLSIHPLLNSLAWFLRVFLVQLVVIVGLIFILKVSIHGSAYFSYVSMGFLLPTMFLWTVQVLSRSILMAHLFSSILKASIWSTLIYLVSCWLALSSTIQLPFFLHLLASAWLPFYSIKQLVILLLHINKDLGRWSGFTQEVFSVWFSMVGGIALMWLLAFYLEPIRPGKYGLPRPWTWPLDFILQRRSNRSAKEKSTSESMIRPVSLNECITVRVDCVTKAFGRHKREQQIAVDHLSFELEGSKIYGLIGPNGSGKTTTMEMICGLLASDSGSIHIHGQSLREHRSAIGYCPQQDMLFAYLTAREQLEFYARVRTTAKDIDQKQIDQLLALMEMTDHAHRLCHTLSGGMQRKLSILCAFVGQANVILLDEPSSSLDPVARRLLRNWLREYKTDRTILVSSHLLDEVEELCDSVIILDSGRMRTQGSILELKQQYARSTDRLHLDTIPSYVPRDWIIDEGNRLIEIPNRQQCIQLLGQLERDHIRYALKNVTLNDVFLQLTSSSDAPCQGKDGLGKQSGKALFLDADVNQSQMKSLFLTRTSPRPWLEQCVGVFIRRAQVLARQARLLPLVILLYLIYALVPSHLLAWNSPSESIHYIVSSPSEFLDRLNLNDVRKTIVPPVDDFQQQLLSKSCPCYRTRSNGDRLDIAARSSNLRHRRKFIGLQVLSSEHLACYLPSPVLSNLLVSCLPIFSSLTNRSLSPLQIISGQAADSPSTSTLSQFDPSYLCFYTLPPAGHSSVLILSLIFVVCAALTIQDYTSELYSYSLIHGLHPLVHWFTVFLTDLLLCSLWFVIHLLITRFVHASAFDGAFFVLAPLFFLVTLPFIYLLARVFRSPLLGAMAILFLLQLAHLVNTLRIFIELFRGYRTLAVLFQIGRWLLILLFPNVNVSTLVVAVLRRRSSCPLDSNEQLFYERYPHKILIHTLIFIAQFFLYLIFLILMDTSAKRLFTVRNQKKRHGEEEDEDVLKERRRVAAMKDPARLEQALVVENLSKSFHGSATPAVNRLTFAIAPRECFGLLGFNGSGKFEVRTNRRSEKSIPRENHDISNVGGWTATIGRPDR